MGNFRTWFWTCCKFFCYT